MQDEHDRLRSEIQAAVTAETHHVIRFVHLTRHASSKATQIPVELADFGILPAETAAHYYDATDDSENKPSSSSIFVLLISNDPVRFDILLSTCKRLSLSSALMSHIQSVVARWFTSVLALVGAVGYEYQQFTSLHCYNPQWYATAVLSHTWRSDPKAYASTSNAGKRSTSGSALEVQQSLTADSLITNMALSTAVLPVWRDDGVASVAALWVGTIVPLLVEQWLPLTVPSSVSGLASYSTTTQQMQMMSFFLRDYFEPSSFAPLSKWCAEINHHFLRSIRLVTLDRCRELLVNNDYQVYHADQPAALSSALGSYPPLFFPTSTSPYLAATKAFDVSSLTPTPEPVAAPPVQLLPLRLQARVLSSYLASQSPISLHVCLYSATLFELLGQSLHAYTVSPDLSTSLLAVLCDCVLLILSIPGVYNSDELQSVSYMSWLYANDCSYIAVCVERMAAFVVTECRLAAVSSASFFPSIGGTAPPPQFASDAAMRLLALVEPLRAVSQHWRRHTLTQLTSSVISSLDALPPFTSLDSPATLRITLSSLQQTIHTLTRSLRSLKDVERADGRQLIGRRLVERLCDAVVSRVLAVEDVGIEETKGMEAAVAAVNCGEVREVVGGGWEGRGWRRLEAVQLLIGSEQTLVKMEAEWEAGMLSALEAAEVCGWIRALYQDSVGRQRLLQKIGGGVGGGREQ